MDAPQVVVGKLASRRRLEGSDPAALGVQAGEDRLDDAVLAGGVDPLQHEEDTPPALGVEARLELLEPRVQALEVFLARVLGEAERFVRIAPRNHRVLPRRDAKVIQHWSLGARHTALYHAAVSR